MIGWLARALTTPSFVMVNTHNAALSPVRRDHDDDDHHDHHHHHRMPLETATGQLEHTLPDHPEHLIIQHRLETLQSDRIKQATG